MTVTESGYYINEDNNLNLNLQIVKDNISKKEKYNYFFFSLISIKKKNGYN